MARSAKRCGTCRVWGENFYKGRASAPLNACCIDAVQDVPSSWNSNNFMRESDGEGCPTWRSLAAAAPAVEATR